MPAETDRPEIDWRTLDIPTPNPNESPATFNHLNGVWLASVAADKSALALAHAHSEALLQAIDLKDQQIAALRDLLKAAEASNEAPAVAAEDAVSGGNHKVASRGSQIDEAAAVEAEDLAVIGEVPEAVQPVMTDAKVSRFRSPLPYEAKNGAPHGNSLAVKPA